MTVGIVGLGLIGGSCAKAYALAGHKVLGIDIDEAVLSFAKLDTAVTDTLSRENIGECDLILIAVYPKAAAMYLEKEAPFIDKNSLVIDFCGTKERICEVGFKVAKKYGFTYAGGHPMAGTHHSGFKYSHADLFKGQPMVIVPSVYDDMELLERIASALSPMKFGGISVTTAKEHDRIIAFTSQLAHVVSNAYVKSPTAKVHSGFSAGSYQDLTRVARLNPLMWSQLFLENSSNLIFEIDCIIKNLNRYKEAILKKDADSIISLLEEGSRIKAEIDG